MTPTCQKFQPSTIYRKTGRPTTNHTSRDPNRKNRAAASRLTARLFENIWPNLAFLLAVPSPPRISSAVVSKAVITTPARMNKEGWKPTKYSSKPPTKKPTPFKAFFEPVRTATHLKRVEWEQG
jgi:hypothetical protein